MCSSPLRRRNREEEKEKATCFGAFVRQEESVVERKTVLIFHAAIFGCLGEHIILTGKNKKLIFFNRNNFDFPCRA